MALAETAVVGAVAEAAAADAAATKAVTAAAAGGNLAPWAIPALGVVSLIGVVAWEFWKGYQDEKELKAKTA